MKTTYRTVKPATRNSFRYDINGLRAWAVVAVVLFHFDVPGFSGGFVGVDIFFVISGYLMAGIIFKKIQQHHADGESWLLGFYLSRARRIIPALYVLLAALLAMGWFILPPPEYRELGVHAATALAFLSNVQFWREAGYFDAASQEKWMLHTWSLSVEWQFYLVLPLLMWAVWRLVPSRRAAVLALAAILVASLSLSVSTTDAHPSSNFYLLTSRAWEMLAGGMVVLLAHQWRPRVWLANLLELLGLSLITWSILSLDSQVLWPGFLATVPVLGTVLVLVASRQNSLWTNNRITQALGVWSYSIYLWHWPLLVALVYLELQGKADAVSLGLILSVLIGWTSFRWIEKPASDYLLRVGCRKTLLILGLAGLVLASISIFIRMNNGVPGRLAPGVEAAAAEAYNYNPRRSECHVLSGNNFKGCVFGGPNIRVMLVGDSHAASVVNSVKSSLPDKQDGVLAYTYSSCPTIFGTKEKNTDRKCAEFNEWVMTQISAQPSNIPLLIVNRTTAYISGNQNPNDPSYEKPLIYFDEMNNSIDEKFIKEFKNRLIESACTLAKTRSIYMMRPIPEMPVDVPKYAARRILFGKDPRISIGINEYNQRHAVVIDIQNEASRRCGVKIIDPTPALCPDGVCSGLIMNRPIYYDDHHLSMSENKLNSVFKQLWE